jgi:hypothetical protein
MLPRQQHLEAPRSAAHAHGHDRVLGLATVRRMFLQHGKDPLARCVDEGLGEAALPSGEQRREPTRPIERTAHVERLVGVIDEHEQAAARAECSAAILMHATARAVRCGEHVPRRAARFRRGRYLDDGVPALVLGAGLAEVHVETIDRDVAWAARRLGHVGRGDARAPAAVTSVFFHRSTFACAFSPDT